MTDKTTLCTLALRSYDPATATSAQQVAHAICTPESAPPAATQAHAQETGGFTFVQLCAALVLIAIFRIVAWPVLRTWWHRYKGF